MKKGEDMEMAFKVKEVADIVGISVRTLHHYDKIGLLSPDDTTEAGYRLYSEENLSLLQQILFFRELGFPLKKIKEIITSSTYDQKEALEVQHQMLLKKRKRLDNMIATIEKTMKWKKGEIQMSQEEKFQGFDFTQHPYEQEARNRWGDKAVDDSTAFINKKSKAEQEELSGEMNAIYRRLATVKEEAPNSAEAQAAIKEWYDFLNNSTGHHYTLEAFKGLGQMYVADERFTKNIDRFGDGLAQFMCAAMEVFADRQSK